MKRLSALIIGVFMVASAQTAFSLTGDDGLSATDASDASIAGIASAQSLGQDKIEETNVMKIEVGLDNHNADTQTVYLRPSVVDGSEFFYVQNGEV